MGRVVCPQGHAFDIARSGYINLLQPQDRRSKNPGDSPAAVKARRIIHELGATEALLRDIARLTGASLDDCVLDIGSGDGFYLGSLFRQIGFQAVGIDISVPAADAAAKRYPDGEWIVANADRFIPYADHSFTKVLSLTARMNCKEFHRVIHPDGQLLLAVPAPDDLIELRGAGRDRVPRTIEAFALQFQLVEQGRATVTTELDAIAVQNLLLSIYRPMQPAPPKAGRVTFSLDLLLFQPRKS